MGVGDEEEEVAAGIRAEEDVFRGQLAPCDPLATEEQEAEEGSSGDPRHGAPSNRFAEA